MRYPTRKERARWRREAYKTRAVLTSEAPLGEVSTAYQRRLDWRQTMIEPFSYAAPDRLLSLLALITTMEEYIALLTSDDSGAVPSLADYLTEHPMKKTHHTFSGEPPSD